MPTLRARNAVMWSFALNGFGFASWISRIPEARDSLSLSNAELGLLLLALSAGSVVALPASGALVHRWGAPTVVRWGVVGDVAGLLIVGVSASWLGSIPLTALGLMLYGVGVAVWDVAMNVEGAAVERELGRNIMPRFHAGFSLGTVSGALVGATTVAAGVPMAWHLTACALLMLVVTTRGTRAFLPSRGEAHAEARPR